MSFENYWFLLILLILPLFLVWQKRRKKPQGVLTSLTREIADKFAAPKLPFSYRLPKFFFLISVFLLALSMAKPVGRYRQKEIIDKGREIALVLDFSVSVSEYWRDPPFNWSELVFTETKVKYFSVYFLESLSEKDKVYLVLFADRAFSLGPYSPKEAIVLLKQEWFSREPNGMWENGVVGYGTEIGKAVSEALAQLLYPNAEEWFRKSSFLNRDKKKREKSFIVRDALLGVFDSLIKNSKGKNFDTEGLKGKEGDRIATEKELSTFYLDPIKFLRQLENTSIVIITDGEFPEINSNLRTLNWILTLRLCREVGIRVYGICLGYDPSWIPRAKILEQFKEAVEDTGGYLYKIDREERKRKPEETTKRVEEFLRKIEVLEKGPLVSRIVVVKQDYQTPVLIAALLCLALSVGLPWFARCRVL